MARCVICLSTDIIEIGIDMWRCDSCSREWVTCGNCDVTGLIPTGKNTDDCVVCQGTSFIECTD